MKKYIIMGMVAFSSLSCNGQSNTVEPNKLEKQADANVTEPKGSWKVNKEFDENGNLIKYDSVYTWSSHSKLNSLQGKDSLLASINSRFSNLGFNHLFSQDSIISNQFFNDDFFKSGFGSGFIDLDKIRQEMMERQRKFLENYSPQFIKPENEVSE